MRVNLAGQIWVYQVLGQVLAEEHVSKVIDFQLERLRVNLAGQIWVDACSGVRSKI